MKNYGITNRSFQSNIKKTKRLINKNTPKIGDDLRCFGMEGRLFCSTGENRHLDQSKLKFGYQSHFLCKYRKFLKQVK